MGRTIGGMDVQKNSANRVQELRPEGRGEGREGHRKALNALCM